MQRSDERGERSAPSVFLADAAVFRSKWPGIVTPLLVERSHGFGAHSDEPVFASNGPVFLADGSVFPSHGSVFLSDDLVFPSDDPVHHSMGKKILVTAAPPSYSRAMEDRYLNELGAFRKRKTFLEDPENKPIWNGSGPARFAALAAEAYPLIDALGALGANQDVGPSPGYAQQNTHEENLEADAIIMSAALSEYYKDLGMVADAQQWDIPDTGWTRAREQKLLDQGKLLLNKLTPLSVGTPAPGADYGITAARVATYSGFVDKFAEEIGKPGARRADRKGMSASIPERCRELRGKFRSMDRLVKQYRGTPEGDRFADGFINSGHIDDLPGSGGTPPTPPAPPAP